MFYQVFHIDPDHAPVLFHGLEHVPWRRFVSRGHHAAELRLRKIRNLRKGIKRNLGKVYMDCCDFELVKKIMASEEAISNGDGKIIVKAVPDNDVTGQMDKREFFIRSAIYAFQKSFLSHKHIFERVR